MEQALALENGNDWDPSIRADRLCILSDKYRSSAHHENYSLAFTHLSNAVELAPNVAIYQCKLGWLHIKVNRWENIFILFFGKSCKCSHTETVAKHSLFLVFRRKTVTSAFQLLLVRANILFTLFSHTGISQTQKGVCTKHMSLIPPNFIDVQIWHYSTHSTRLTWIWLSNMPNKQTKSQIMTPD